MWNICINRFWLRFFFSFCLFTTGTAQLHAVFGDSSTVKIKTDSSDVRLRKPNQANQDKYYNDEYYNYKREKVIQKETFFDKLLRKLFNWEPDPNIDDDQKAPSENSGQQILNYIILAIAVGILLWAIIRLASGGVGGKLFSGRSAEKDVSDASIDDIDIHAINYEHQIALARDRGDYRYAIRLWFLNTLKEMTDRQLLNWKPDKTNMDYFYELNGQPVQQQFGEVSRVYDYAWYGERAINQSDYSNAEMQFRNLLNQFNK